MSFPVLRCVFDKYDNFYVSNSNVIEVYDKNGILKQTLKCSLIGKDIYTAPQAVTKFDELFVSSTWYYDRTNHTFFYVFPIWNGQINEMDNYRQNIFPHHMFRTNKTNYATVTTHGDLVTFSKDTTDFYK